MSTKQGRRRVRVGVFLAVLFAVLVAVVIALGEKSGLFEADTTLYAHFTDVNGLNEGAPVRLSGIHVGMVEEVAFSSDRGQPSARVTFTVKSRYMSRLRADSLASIGTKGLLGDALLNLTVGSPDASELRDGAILKTTEASSLADMAAGVMGATKAIQHAAEQAAVALSLFADKEAAADTKRALDAVADLLEGAREHRGVLYTLLVDEQAGQDVRQTLGDVRDATQSVRAGVRRLEGLLAQAQAGPGAMHSLFYDPEGDRLVSELAATSEDLHALTSEVRSGQGLLHELLYNPEAGQALQELAEAGAGIHRIVDTIEQGQGTLGGLIVDPTVYEDLKSTLGGIERNVMLKALVRFAIKEGDLRRPAILAQEPQTAEGSGEGEP